MKTLAVLHETDYRYHDWIQHAYHLACLKPVDSAVQKLVSYDIDIDPVPDTRSVHRDCFGNWIEYFGFHHPHQSLQVFARSKAQRFCIAAQDLARAELSWRDLRRDLAYQAGRPCQAEGEYVFESPFVPFLEALRPYAMAIFDREPGLIKACQQLCQKIHADFRYIPRSTVIETPLAEVFQRKTGVCQDFAHVMIACLRSIGLSARYVSGYLLTRAAPGQPKRRGVDASHAWVAIYCPSLEHPWLELDPTNNALVEEDYVSLAYGRDFGDVSPLRGVIHSGAGHELRVAVTVEALSVDAP